MRTNPNNARTAFLSALAAGLCLGVPEGLMLWRALLRDLLPPRLGDILAVAQPEQGGPYTVIAIILGGMLWGLALNRITGHPWPWRLALAGGLGMLVGTSLAFSMMRGDLLDRYVPGLWTHAVFTALLVISVIIVTTSTGIALGLASRSWRTAARLVVRGGVAAALAVVVVAVILGALGVYVGTGNAAMVKLTALGTLVAAMAGGAAMGMALAQSTAALPPDIRGITPTQKTRQAADAQEIG